MIDRKVFKGLVIKEMKKVIEIRKKEDNIHDNKISQFGFFDYMEHPTKMLIIMEIFDELKIEMFIDVDELIKKLDDLKGEL